MPWPGRQFGSVCARGMHRCRIGAHVLRAGCVVKWRVARGHAGVELLQCAALNFGQYGLATLLLNSPLKKVKILRAVLGAPKSAKVRCRLLCC